MNDAETLIRREGSLGRITLNRPGALNALSLGMIRVIDQALSEWQDDPEVVCVLVEGAGPRGLCAGGDIRIMRQHVLDGAPEQTDSYLATEYVLNGRIATFPKPYVAFMDGIVMGGGVGLSAHGSHRIVTERTRLAMPEVGIGFLPDVGATWLLSRVPGELGTHVGLTGCSLTAFDAIACGLADLHVPSERLERIADGMRTCADADAVAQLITPLATAPVPTGFATQPDWIADCYRGDDALAILAALRASDEPAARQAAAAITAACPMSVAVTLRALRLAAWQNGLVACQALELRLGVELLRRNDFIEGVRAAVVDKDRAPRWAPPTLEEIDPADVDRLFGV